MHLNNIRGPLLVHFDGQPTCSQSIRSNSRHPQGGSTSRMIIRIQCNRDEDNAMGNGGEPLEVLWNT